MRHAQATEVRLAIRARDHALIIELEDNGAGFAPDAAANGGDGLRNMRERLTQLHGACEIDTQPGRGTFLRFRLPLGSGSPRQ